MFSSDHAIHKIAVCVGEADDLLPYAEELVLKWSTQDCDEVELAGSDLAIAALLLEDNLLPSSARVAFARLMLKTIEEARENRLTLKCLGFRTPKPGRKKTDLAETGYRLHKVYQLINTEGMTPNDAYDIVAKECFKSPDTIRREYERAMKKTRDRTKNKEQSTGKSTGDFPGDAVT